MLSNARPPSSAKNCKFCPLQLQANGLSSQLPKRPQNNCLKHSTNTMIRLRSTAHKCRKSRHMHQPNKALQLSHKHSCCYMSLHSITCTFNCITIRAAGRFFYTLTVGLGEAVCWLCTVLSLPLWLNTKLKIVCHAPTA